jgi:hypothetical protein
MKRAITVAVSLTIAITIGGHSFILSMNRQSDVFSAFSDHGI